MPPEPMRKIRFLVSLAGNGHAYQIGEEAELVEWLAFAYCSEPVGDPRAEPVGWDLSDVKKKRGGRKKPEAAVDETRETRDAGAPVAPEDDPADDAGEGPDVELETD